MNFLFDNSLIFDITFSIEYHDKRIKLIRKELNMTQEQLAQHLGIGKAALSMIETGKCGLSCATRTYLFRSERDPDWLDTGKGEMFNAEPSYTAFRLRSDNSLPMQSVPLYSIEGHCGLVPCSPTGRRTSP